MVECKDGLSAPRALLVLDHNIIKDGRPPYSLVVRSLRSNPYAEGMVECKDDPSAPSALLVLEHNIKKYSRSWYSLVLRSLRSHPYADGRVECKDDPSASRALPVLENNIKKGMIPSVANPSAECQRSARRVCKSGRGCTRS